MAATAEVKVDFYEKGDGTAPVEQFLDGLERPARAKGLAIIKNLKDQGLNLPFPYSSQVKGKLRELRTQYGKDKLRILYFSNSRRTFILLHGILKRTQKLEASDIKIAQQRMEQHEARLGGKKHDHKI